MEKTIFAALAAIILLVSIAHAATDTDFSIVLFPDTQNMVQNYHSVWETMPAWVVANETYNNILAVLGMGDISNTNSDAEFAEAANGWNEIKDAGIIYVPIRGNHDSSDTPFNTYFGPGYFSGKSWYGGSSDGTTNNDYYVTFNVGSHKYLDIALSYNPDSSALSWAQGIIDANPDREVIVSTHSYLNNDGSRTSEGNNIWNGIVKDNPGIFLVVCGHMHGGTVYKAATGSSGNTVHQFLCDYQDTGSTGGDGYMCILDFQPSENNIHVYAYSDYLKTIDSSSAHDLFYNGTLACIPKNCTELGYGCGNASDGCGGTLNCGNCSAGYTCINNNCSLTCIPQTCLSLGYSCGTSDDGCSGTLDCGNCSADQICRSGQCIPNQTTTPGMNVPRECHVNQQCTAEITRCTDGILLVRNKEGSPINVRNMITSGDFPITFFSEDPYRRSFVPSAQGVVSVLKICFSGTLSVARVDINIAQ